MSTIKLLHGDTFKILPCLEKESFDMIFVDPPYFLSNGGFTCNSGQRTGVNKGSWDKSQGIQKDFEFHLRWLNLCRHLLKPTGTIWICGTYHNIYACGFALQLLNFHILNEIAWYKPNASPNLSCRMFTASHETLIWARKSKKQSGHTFNYETMKFGETLEDSFKKADKQMRSVWEIPVTPSSEKTFGKYPAQKPLGLLKRIVLSSTNEGGLVLDPFAGSGTTGVSCLRYGRKFVGIDSSEEAFNLSRERIKPDAGYFLVAKEDFEIHHSPSFRNLDFSRPNNSQYLKATGAA